MSILYTALAFLIVLGVLVIVHEWGHFIAARLCRIRVDEFSIGFGPRAVRIGKRGDTEYNIRWVPLGGFVKIAGMEPDEEPLMRAADKVKNLRGAGTAEEETTSDIDSGTMLTEIPLVAENVPNLNETPEQKQRDETEGFYAHPLWQRALVIFAGPFMSFMFGYLLIFFIALTLGVPSGPPVNRVEAINPGSVAQRMGLKPGDTIIGINGAKVTSGNQLVTTIHNSPGKPVHLDIQRGQGTVLHLTGTPQMTQLGDGTSVGALGFMPVTPVRRMTAGEAFSVTNDLTKEWFRQIGQLLRRHNIKEIRKSAGGPIFIAQATKQAVDAGGVNVPLLAAQISMSLALFNLLPIPILDGGHLLIFFIEAVRRGKRLTMEQQQNFMLAGLAVIGVLFVLIMFNDILRSIHPGAQ